MTAPAPSAPALAYARENRPRSGKWEKHTTCSTFHRWATRFAGAKRLSEAQKYETRMHFG
jgi:hypothetical protein